MEGPVVAPQPSSYTMSAKPGACPAGEGIPHGKPASYAMDRNPIGCFRVAGTGLQSGRLRRHSAARPRRGGPGGALLQVWGGGESEPRNARILGVSECSDLAVIDIEGGDFPYLDWHPGDINVGLEVYAAGFPLGDPECTLTKGIVSKAQTSGGPGCGWVGSGLADDE